MPKKRSKSATKPVPFKTKPSRKIRIRPRKQASTDLFFQHYLRNVGISESEFEPVKRFVMLREIEKVSAARRLIQQSIIDKEDLPDVRVPLAVRASEDLLPGYSTLDEPHRNEIKKLIGDITAYLADSSRKRPLNCLMLATPGAGKSHFIKRLAAKMKTQRVEAVTFNMATMQSHDDMAQPVDELRNLKVNDQFPLLFLDEFDSDSSRYAGLLPLLWDGELHIGHRDLKLGKAVIVLAGSNPDLPKVMAQSAKMQVDAEAALNAEKPIGKLIDLLSRINGGIINIPDLDLRSRSRDRRVDKVCMAITLLKIRFGEGLSEVPRPLLRFIAHTQFRYGVRSIAHLVDLIDSSALKKNALRLGALRLPFSKESTLRDSSLKLHLLDKDSAFGVVNRWRDFVKDKAIVDLRVQRFAALIRMLARRG